MHIVYNGPKIFVVWFTSISIGCLSSAEQIFLTHIYLLKECTAEERLSMQSKIYCFVISNTLIIMYFTNLFIFLNNHNGCYSQTKTILKQHTTFWCKILLQVLHERHGQKIFSRNPQSKPFQTYCVVNIRGNVATHTKINLM